MCGLLEILSSYVSSSTETVKMRCGFGNELSKDLALLSPSETLLRLFQRISTVGHDSSDHDRDQHDPFE